MPEKVLPKHSLELLSDFGDVPRLFCQGGRWLAEPGWHSTWGTVYRMISIFFAPQMLVPFDWKECKAFFVREARTIAMS